MSFWVMCADRRHAGLVELGGASGRVVRAHKRAQRVRSHGRPGAAASGASPRRSASGGPRRGWRREHTWHNGTAQRLANPLHLHSPHRRFGPAQRRKGGTAARYTSARSAGACSGYTANERGPTLRRAPVPEGDGMPIRTGCRRPGRRAAKPGRRRGADRRCGRSWRDRPASPRRSADRRIAPGRPGRR